MKNIKTILILFMFITKIYSTEVFDVFGQKLLDTSFPGFKMENTFSSNGGNSVASIDELLLKWSGGNIAISSSGDLGTGVLKFGSKIAVNFGEYLLLREHATGGYSSFNFKDVVRVDTFMSSFPFFEKNPTDLLNYQVAKTEKDRTDILALYLEWDTARTSKKAKTGNIFFIDSISLGGATLQRSVGSKTPSQLKHKGDFSDEIPSELNIKISLLRSRQSDSVAAISSFKLYTNSALAYSYNESDPIISGNQSKNYILKLSDLAIASNVDLRLSIDVDGAYVIQVSQSPIQNMYEGFLPDDVVAYGIANDTLNGFETINIKPLLKTACNTLGFSINSSFINFKINTSLYLNRSFFHPYNNTTDYRKRDAIAFVCNVSRDMAGEFFSTKLTYYHIDTTYSTAIGSDNLIQDNINKDYNYKQPIEFPRYYDRDLNGILDSTQTFFYLAPDYRSELNDLNNNNIPDNLDDTYLPDYSYAPGTTGGFAELKFFLPHNFFSVLKGVARRNLILEQNEFTGIFQFGNQFKHKDILNTTWLVQYKRAKDDIRDDTKLIDDEMLFSDSHQMGGRLKSDLHPIKGMTIRNILKYLITFNKENGSVSSYFNILQNGYFSTEVFYCSPRIHNILEFKFNYKILNYQEKSYQPTVFFNKDDFNQRVSAIATAHLFPSIDVEIGGAIDYLLSKKKLEGNLIYSYGVQSVGSGNYFGRKFIGIIGFQSKIQKLNDNLGYVDNLLFANLNYEFN